jgi:hypothetical protein
MMAKYFLAVATCVFFAAALIRGPRSPQGRIWLRVAAIFAAVSLWLFARG